MINAADSHWMARALQLAERGLNTTSPNPRVGCVLVRDEQIVGEGWHEYAGEPHAEVLALREACEAARGATAYVTLEPCSHHGRTPPCADALIEAGVVRVVAAVQDPNPQVSGQGLARLRAAGIEVECGLMETPARELNIGFFERMTRGLPWVRSKIGMSLDGRTALNNGVSKWISGEAARQDVQYWRARSCAVLTGIGTVLADNPQLNVREIDADYPNRWGGGRDGQPGEDALDAAYDYVPRAVRQPLRVVLDSQLRLPLTARLLLDAERVAVYTITTDKKKIAALERTGARVIVLNGVNGKMDLGDVLRDLAVSGNNEVLVEAGSTLNGALLSARLVDELVLYMAPQLLGDMARGMASLGELTALEQRIELDWRDVRHIGRDLRIVARVKR